MNLIELIFMVQGSSVEDQSEMLHDLGVDGEMIALVLDQFDKKGNLAGSTGEVYKVIHHPHSEK